MPALLACNRWINAEFDATHEALRGEFDPVKRAALVIKLNDLAVSDGYVIPIFTGPQLTGVANKLERLLSAWDNDLRALGYWTRGA